jgi:hypothetical protein
MPDQMILSAGPMRDLPPDLVPPFATDGAVPLGDYLPRRFAEGSNVVVYTQRNNRQFVYIGVLREAYIDEPGRRLTFSQYTSFSSPIVAYDEAHGIDRPELRAPLNGWGQHGFNYVNASTIDAILSAEENPVEQLLWKAVSTCLGGDPQHRS